MSKIAQRCKHGTLHLIKIPIKYEREVGIVAEKSFSEAGKLFAFQKPVEVTIFPKIPEIIIPEIGIGGRTTERRDIIIAIDFSRHNIENIIRTQLPSIIYHELSHVIRSIHKNLNITLLESLVTEGIASYIEKGVFKRKVLYIEPIIGETKYWKIAQKNFENKKYSYKDYSEWFFGANKLPRWIGYRIGYLMIERYMQKNPKTSFTQLIHLDSKKIIKF